MAGYARFQNLFKALRGETMLSNEELDILEQIYLSSANDHLGKDWKTCRLCAMRSLIYDLKNARSRLNDQIRGNDGCCVQGPVLQKQSIEPVQN